MSSMVMRILRKHDDRLKDLECAQAVKKIQDLENAQAIWKNAQAIKRIQKTLECARRAKEAKAMKAMKPKAMKADAKKTQAKVMKAKAMKA